LYHFLTTEAKIYRSESGGKFVKEDTSDGKHLTAGFLKFSQKIWEPRHNFGPQNADMQQILCFIYTNIYAPIYKFSRLGELATEICTPLPQLRVHISATDWGRWSTSHPDRFTPGKDPVPIVHKAGWAPGPVWTRAEILGAIEIRSANLPGP